jgi:hypothetical protein
MAKDKVETSFHLSKEVIEALKIKAVKEGKRFSRIAEEGLRQYMGLPPIKPPKKSKS